MIKSCLNCELQFNAKESEIKRGNALFCSLSCSSKYKSKQAKLEHNVTCSYCGCSFHRKPSRLRSRSHLYFCCREHKDLAQRIGGIKEIQPSHYGNELASYRDKAFRSLPNKCTRCNYDKHKAALVVHHKNRDRSNNDISNLEILCCNCHAIEHWSSVQG